MGLLDFWKKLKTDDSAEKNKIDNSESENEAVAFKGDLALIGKDSVEKEFEVVHTDLVNTGQATDNKDSPDSVIFMSFILPKKGLWLCPECGTRNEEYLNGCIVCGLKKTRRKAHVL